MPAPINNPEYVPTQEVSTTSGSITRPWVTRYPGHLERQMVNTATLPGAGIAGGYARDNELRPLTPSPVTRHKAINQQIAATRPALMVSNYGRKYDGLRAPRWAEGAYGKGAGGVTAQNAVDSSANAPSALAAIAAINAAARRRRQWGG